MQAFVSSPALQPFEQQACPLRCECQTKSLTSIDTGTWACSPPVHIMLNVAEATSQEYGSASILLW